MALNLESPWAIALLLFLPLLWIAALRSRANLSRRHLYIVTAVRSIGLALLVLALARPAWIGISQDVSVVYALDVSRSVSAGFIEEALGWIDRAQAQAAPARMRIIAFADRPAVVQTTDEVRALKVANSSSSGSKAIDQSATNLQSALDAALSAQDRDRVKRVVLFSDGNATDGDLWRSIPRLKEANVRVFAIAAKIRDERDAWIDGLEIPDSVRDGEPFAAVVRIFSPGHVGARVRLSRGSQALGRREIKLAPGLNRVSFDVRLRGAGAATLTAEVMAQGDTVRDNDRFLTSVWIGQKPRVLYVEGQPDGARFLASALRSEGIEVDLLGAQALPADAASLMRYDAVIVSDTPATRLAEPQMRALESYVRDLGGGFLFAGGENAFGEAGYAGSRIEKILPVEFKAREKRRDLALVIAIDRSYSMKGRKMEYAKEAARASLDLLEEQHLFGVVAFDSQPYISVPMQQVRSKRRAEDQISRIQASGQTNIYPALGIVYRMLQQVDAKAKHVILLSDGDTHPADFERLLERMQSANIIVSSVTIGQGGDPQLMKNIAKWGGGRSYTAASAESIPQIFVEETNKAVRSNLVEKPVRPMVKRSVQALSGVDFIDAPPLKGHISTKARDTAEIYLETEDGAPLLARWQYGLGKTLIFSSDVKNRWAADWINWSGYGKLWSQLVRETMRRDSGESVELRAYRKGEEAVISLGMLTEDGRFRNDLAPRVELSRANGAIEQVSMRQAGPGRYEARVALHDSRAVSFSLLAAGGVGRQSAARAGIRTLYPGFADEYRSLPPNVALLTAVAEQTGGKFAPSMSEVFEALGDEGRYSRALWPWLVLAALAFYLIDILMRRAAFAWRRFGS